MALNRADIIDKNFRRFVAESNISSSPREISLSKKEAIDLFHSQLLSRHMDLESRRLKAKNLGFYTIGSYGHEGNAIFGRLLRITDPALLHYRSGAFMVERSKQGKEDVVQNTMLSFCASSEDPISGGRHKVWGSKKLWVPPQTSTIASHLPKAVGMAIALDRAKKLKIPLPIPEDSIIYCSFGDASTNHSTALGAFNAAQWTHFQNVPVPILLVCEDNGIGISVHTPQNWIATSFSNRPGIKYFYANGLDFTESFDVAREAMEYCRTRRAPVFFHLETVRLLGHAGSDVETEYLTTEEIEAFEARDPLLTSAQRMMELGFMNSDEILSMYESCHKEVEKTSVVAAKAPKLSSAEEVMAPLAPYHSKEVEHEAKRTNYKSKAEIESKPRHMAMLINWGLADLLSKYPEMMIFGEDVAKKGGVYHVTTGLMEKFGLGRVFNTLLDEQTILGLGIGAAHLGFLPVPEIQYLAYYHNAEDQIRGEAGSLPFFSKGQFRNPMVVRIASLGYQKGFGGHFHNDNSIAALRDVPGIVVAVPSRGDDAVEMMRTAMALAKVDGRVVLFLEPIALYMTKDLYEAGDGKWNFEFPSAGKSVSLGEGRLYHSDGKDLTILTYGNGLYLSLRAAKALKEKHKISARILDLRWLNPLPEKQIREEAKKTGKVLVVDECRRTGGIAEAILALLSDQRDLVVDRLNAEDTYIPLGPAWETVLPSESQIIKMAQRLAKIKI